ncbi:probable peptidoglycan muropeptide transporter SLC46 isoform X2 [Epargyreus clarus]
MYRTCVYALHHTHEECKGFLSPTKTNETNYLEKDVQKYTTMVSTVKSVLDALGPAILSLFLGAWSNKYGRRPLITWSLFGMTLTTMLTVIYTMIETLGPWWYIVTILPTALTGGFVVLFTGSYCYISDVSPPEKSTLRMAVVDFTVSAGMVVGSLIAKDLILSIGNVFLLLFGTALNVLAYSYASIFIPESLPGALEGGFTKILDISLVKDMARECLKKRPNNGRAQILLLTASRIISVFVLYGTSILEYMYTRKKLQWALSDYNIFTAVGTVIGFVAGFLGLVVGQKMLRISDIIFAIFSVASKATEFFIKAFAVTSWQMYLGSAVSMFDGLSSPLIRSYLSKSLSADDIVKVFAMMFALEGVTPLIAPIVFTAVYTSTISTFPGAFFLLSGTLTFISVILLGLVKYCSSRNNQMDFQPLDNEDVDCDEST